MLTSQEYQHRAKNVIASHAEKPYVKAALVKLAAEFNNIAGNLEHSKQPQAKRYFAP